VSTAFENSFDLDLLDPGDGLAWEAEGESTAFGSGNVRVLRSDVRSLPFQGRLAQQHAVRDKSNSLRWSVRCENPARNEKRALNQTGFRLVEMSSSEVSSKQARDSAYDGRHLKSGWLECRDMSPLPLLSSRSRPHIANSRPQPSEGCSDT
jgi:hypothetical protein